MPSETEDPKTPDQQTPPTGSQSPADAADKRLNKIANDAAKRATDDEKRYDREHPTFTK